LHQRRRFRILETLGKGGFGTVYRAEMMAAGGFAKQVALKVLHYEGDQADDIARRLRDEARVLGLIRHRAVVGVNSLVPLEQGWGVVMEYINGVDLSTCIKAGALPAGVCLEVAEEVAAALEAAYNGANHETGDPLRLVHRDIKPSNIRITSQGEVKLLDFGVATADFSAREAEDSTEFVMGSTRYMAPERRRAGRRP
jgi:serine/threonine-protein kinase